MVAVDQSANVEDDRIATVKLALGWVMMRERGIRTRGDDRRETHIVGAQPPHGGIKLVTKLALGRASNDERCHLGECRVGDYCGMLNALEFGKAFRATQIGEQ